MKVLLVNGSPRAAGCTNTALEEVAKTLGEAGIETEIFWLGAKPVQDCVACLRYRVSSLKMKFWQLASSKSM